MTTVASHEVSGNAGTCVQLHARNPETVIASQNVFFTFASGRLRYDCLECDAQCCRGHGFQAAGGSELLYQLERRPQLRFFLESESFGGTTTHNWPPECFFLESDRRCGIHVHSGYRSKPETCRLFPFNRLRQVGQYLVVSPHGFLCPLSVTGNSGLSPQSDHGSLLKDLADRGITAHVEECASPVRDLSTLIALERQILALSEQYIANADVLGFIDAQLRLTRDFFPHDKSDRFVSASDAAAVTVAETLASCAEVLGLRPEELILGSREIACVVIAMSTELRARSLFLGKELRNPGARDYGISIQRLPLVLLATYLFAELAGAAGMSNVTYQTVSRLFEGYTPLFSLLAHLDAGLEWRRDIYLPLILQCADLQEPYIRIAKALLPARQRRAPRRLMDVISCAGVQSQDRVRFVKRLAEKTDGKLVLVGTVGREVTPRRQFGKRMQHWAINRVPTDILCSVCQTRDR
jgi:hypothetical protein